MAKCSYTLPKEVEEGRDGSEKTVSTSIKFDDIDPGQVSEIIRGFETQGYEVDVKLGIKEPK